MNAIVEWFAVNLSPFISEHGVVFLISMLPLLELRGGLIAAALLKLPQTQATLLCVIGNILPIPFILLFIRQIFKWLKRTRLLGGLVKRLEVRAMGKSDSIKKYEFWGLLLFVGIPLPGTGAWTGALIASLLEMDLRKSSAAILCGIALAAVIMNIVSYGILGNLLA